MSNVKYIEGKYQYLPGTTIALVVSRFNSFITEKLLEGCLDQLFRHGVPEDSVEIYRVPGAFEIPSLMRQLVRQGKADGIIGLGAVIRGSTPHFNYVSAEVSKGIAHISLDADIPVIYGVITVDSIEQAVERAGTKAGNKGADAAISLLEMMSLFAQLK